MPEGSQLLSLARFYVEVLAILSDRLRMTSFFSALNDEKMSRTGNAASRQTQALRGAVTLKGTGKDEGRGERRCEKWIRRPDFDVDAC